MCSRIAAIRLACVPVLLLIVAAAEGQEIEPRAYSNIPLGVNFLIASYGHASGGLATDPTLALEDANLLTDALVLGYARSISVNGQSGKVDVVVPYVWLDGDAVYAGEPQQRRVAGFGDPRLRISVNLLGAPALSLGEFASFQQRTIVGVSVQSSVPVGQYDSSRYVNIGTNRWWVKPELGVSRAAGPWTFAAAVATTIFGDNSDFVGGRTRSTA
jgi:hypothetical protein